MNLYPQKLLNYLLCCSNYKFPISNTHYVTGKDISCFSKIACIENTLTCFTNNCKCTCQNLKNNIPYLSCRK